MALGDTLMQDKEEDAEKRPHGVVWKECQEEKSLMIRRKGKEMEKKFKRKCQRSSPQRSTAMMMVMVGFGADGRF